MSRRLRPSILVAIVAALSAVLTLGALVAPASAVVESSTLTTDTPQSGRIFRDGVPSACGSAKTYPSLFNPGATFDYDTTTFTAPVTGCITIERVSAECAASPGDLDNVNVHLSVYADSYDPLDQAANYLGDQGSSINNVMALDVVKGDALVVVATNTSGQDACTTEVTISTPPVAAVMVTKIGNARDGANVTFEAADADSFECSIDGAAFTACTSPAIYPGLADGDHTVQVRGTNALGTQDPSTTVAFETCNTVAPKAANVAAAGAKTTAVKAEKKAAKALKKAKKAKAKAKKKLAAAKKSGTPAQIVKAKNSYAKKAKAFKKAAKKKKAATKKRKAAVKAAKAAAKAYADCLAV